MAIEIGGNGFWNGTVELELAPERRVQDIYSVGIGFAPVPRFDVSTR